MKTSEKRREKASSEPQKLSGPLGGNLDSASARGQADEARALLGGETVVQLQSADGGETSSENTPVPRAEPSEQYRARREAPWRAHGRVSLWNGLRAAQEAARQQGVEVILEPGMLDPEAVLEWHVRYPDGEVHRLYSWEIFEALASSSPNARAREDGGWTISEGYSQEELDWFEGPHETAMDSVRMGDRVLWLNTISGVGRSFTLRSEDPSSYAGEELDPELLADLARESNARMLEYVIGEKVSPGQAHARILSEQRYLAELVVIRSFGCRAMENFDQESRRTGRNPRPDSDPIDCSEGRATAGRVDAMVEQLMESLVVFPMVTPI